MITFTKEQLISRINQVTAINKYRISRAPDADGLAMDNELLAIALASLEAEPAGIARHIELRGPEHPAGIHVSLYSRLDDGIELYTAPPAPVSVPDEIESTSGSDFDDYYCDGWNACRAAMLQGAEGKFPDGWVACSERMPEQFVEVLVCTEDGSRYVAALNQSMNWDDGDFFDDIQFVTHWMPLPAAPQQEA